MDTVLYFLILIILICLALIIKENPDVYEKYKFIIYGVLVFFICVLAMSVFINQNRKSNKNN